MSEVTKKMKFLIPCIFKNVHYRVYTMMHVPMGRAHWESSVSKLDYDAKRVASIHMELPSCGKIQYYCFRPFTCTHRPCDVHKMYKHT